MEGIRLYNQRKHDYLEWDKHSTDKVVIHNGKEFALFPVSGYCIRCKGVCDQRKDQIDHCNKCSVKKFPGEIGHHPGIYEVLQTQLSGQCQYVIHIRWILDGDHQCHIQRQKNDQHNSYDKKNRYRPVVTFFYLRYTLFHPNFSSLFSSIRSWNIEISTTTMKSTTALADW